MSRLVILAAAVFEIWSKKTDRQTDEHVKNITPRLPWAWLNSRPMLRNAIGDNIKRLQSQTVVREIRFCCLFLCKAQRRLSHCLFRQTPSCWGNFKKETSLKNCATESYRNQPNQQQIPTVLRISTCAKMDAKFHSRCIFVVCILLL